MEIDPDILMFKSQPVLDIWSSLVVLNSLQRFHPVRIGSKLACCFLAYVPENPNMFSASAPSSIIVYVLHPLGWPASVLRLRASLFCFRGEFSYGEKCVPNRFLRLARFLGCEMQGPPYYPDFFNTLARTSTESAASVFQKIQFDKSVRVHIWESGAKPRSTCNIPCFMGLFL